MRILTNCSTPEYKEILKGLTGTMSPGSLTAIMGSSGGKLLEFNIELNLNHQIAGKTTLLNVLAGRADGHIDGQLLLNGHPVAEAKSLMKHSAYIMQDDIMMSSLTPKVKIL